MNTESFTVEFYFDYLRAVVYISNGQKCGSSRKLVMLCVLAASCYYFGARGIVSVFLFHWSLKGSFIVKTWAAVLRVATEKLRQNCCCKHGTWKGLETKICFLIPWNDNTKVIWWSMLRASCAGRQKLPWWKDFLKLLVFFPFLTTLTRKIISNRCPLCSFE